MILNDNGYEQQGDSFEQKSELVTLSLYIEKHDKKAPEWLSELVWLFSIDEQFDHEMYQYNAIVVARTKKSIYLLPFGHAFWTVEKIADLDFGLDFAERAINSKNISVKGVSYIQRTKMREVTNYKVGKNEFPKASESYFNVSGIPDSEGIYGKNIDCGAAVGIGKSYNFKLRDLEKRKEKLDQFCKLFNEIDITMSRTSLSSVPRMKKIRKSDPKMKILNDKLLQVIKEDSNEVVLDLDVNRIQLIGDQIQLLDNTPDMKVFINKKDLKESSMLNIDLNEFSLIEYIKKHGKNIESIQDIVFEISDNDGSEEFTKGFSQIMHCEFEYEDEVYLLQDGFWSYFNPRFFELIDEKLDEIQKIVKFDDEFNIEYISAEKGSLRGEGGYIEKVCEDDDFVKLHTRSINVSGKGVEIADLYSKRNNELYAIKRGVETGTAIYSFEQCILGFHALSNPKEFQVQEELEKYHVEGSKFEEIDNSTLKKILKCNNSSVVWLVKPEPKGIYKKVSTKTLKLTDFGSLLLKLKIIDWYDFLNENGINAKLYFAIDKPMQEQNKDEILVEAV